MLFTSRVAAMSRLAFAASLCMSVAAPVWAAPMIVTLGSSFARAPVSFNFDGATFTFSATGDFFFPTAVQTGGSGAVRTVFGSPSTDFPDRGSGVLSYGPGLTYASFPSTTTIPYSNGDNYLGLRATLSGADYYGYAFTTNTTLNSFGFETAPNTAFVINTSTATAPVPEPASWAMIVVGFGALGVTARRRRVTARFA